MLRTCQIDRSAAGGAAVGTARHSASGRIEAAGRPPWSCCRLSGDSVADNVTPKRRPTNRLRLVSPKTRFATARPPRQNAPHQREMHTSQKSTPPMSANISWQTWRSWQSSDADPLTGAKRERRAAPALPERSDSSPSPFDSR